ncbi:KilA-N domain-containing protein [Hydrogenophaga sp.]|uniref:KilA-N domain-containing protein n=1 Tax=Hydrogenophaga sp. TaxID=1904254 RepID=UPI0027269DDF|nr:KilA-N domain-containing protein [Hydrogenophaga sp.]MDO9100263.1 KilA-N domain-containing protein [Caldisericota bacterium]MDP1686477.1 KilA-N domain-containing protein [Hydrogenophaga sp.]
MGAVNTPALITRDFNGLAFSFRPDGWFNMTKAAKHFAKRIEHFFENGETLTYMREVAALIHRNPGVLRQATPGRYGGTWAHPKLAVFFARWLDVLFSVWCDAVIEDILEEAADVTIVNPLKGGTCPCSRSYEIERRLQPEPLPRTATQCT